MNGQTKQLEPYFDKIECLRAIAFLGICFAHMGIRYNWSAFGVSIFFVLSGFLMTHKYMNKDIECSFRFRLKFAKNKIKKLYVLHIETMLVVFLFMVVRNVREQATLKDWIVLFVQVLLNIFLLQAWVPSTRFTVSLNGVAWYLSVALFLYFMFPALLKWIKNNKNRYCLLLFALLGVFLQLLMAGVGTRVRGFDETFFIWATYNNPIFRLVDFGIGCILAKLYKKENHQDSKKGLMTVYELLWLVITIIVIIIQKRPHVYTLGLIFWNPTTVYIIVAAGWIYCFAKGKGLIVWFCDNAFFHFIGKLSAYLYLIHGAVNYVYNEIIGFLQISVQGYGWNIYWLTEFAIIIVVTLEYTHLEKYRIGRK